MADKPSARTAETEDRPAVAHGRAGDTVAALGVLVVVIGLVRMVVGLVAWLAIRSQLAAEKIVVPKVSARFGGRAVKDPLTACEEANVIRQLALESTGGKTYGELEASDPVAPTAMNASLLRSSLFTSILAFGVAAGEVAQGALLIVIGAALSMLARRLPARIR